MSPDGSKTSPEERLLRLIRGKSASASVSGATPSAGSVPATSRPRVPMQWGLPAWWLTGVNVLLGLVFFIEVIVWIAVATKSDAPVVVVPPPAPVASAPVDTPNQAVDVPPLASVATHQMFQTPTLGPTSSGTQKQTQEAKELAARLTLLGIVAGESPQAIIEDAKTNKTFFVSTGQSVVEDLVVAEIRENRVVLELYGEKIELSL